jgi:hypothetical protein
MRDIRGDLQDRANLIEKKISAEQAQFEKVVEQLKVEHESRLKNPLAELEAVRLLMDVEIRRLSKATPHTPIPQSLSAPQGMSSPRPLVKLAS